MRRLSRVLGVIVVLLAGCGSRVVTVGVQEDASIDARSPDAGAYDPFDPASACGSAIVETARIPGSVLIVFDRSSTMADPPAGGTDGPTKWYLATRGISSVLASVSDELGAGLMLFPSPGAGDECTVSPEPDVPVAPLGTSRAAIEAALDGASPSGMVTPIVDATRKGWTHLDTLATPGPRGIVLVTDGAESCDGDMTALLDEASAELARGRLTFVVGLTTANNSMSSLALHGGTPRTDTCKAECTSRQCTSDADCPGAAQCFQPFPIEPGLCGCETSVDCVSPQTCMPFPFFGNQCVGPTDCCHYNATESRFEEDFVAALSEVARSFLDSCVFEVPKDDPMTFDPTLVNVGVTFTGEPRMVLPQSDDPETSSWQYTDDTHDSLLIQGPVCDRLRASPATVEIVVGCPTILI